MAKGKRVLVVDDDPATLAVFQKILAADQWEVETSESGRDASAKINPGKYDLIISDLNMPDGSGVELYRAAIQTDPALRSRFLFVSGYADSPEAGTFFLEAGCPVLHKPFRIDEFRELASQVALARPIQAIALPAPWFTAESHSLYSGDIIGRHTLLSLINRIHTARLTGVFHVVLGRVEKKLYFNLGRLVFASSNQLDDGLGEVMLRDGALTQAQFEEAADLLRQGWRFGAAACHLGACTETQMEEWVRRQLTRIAASILDYAAGRYYFFESFEENISPEVGIAVPLGQLVLTAVRQGEGLPLKQLLQDDELSLDLSPDPLVRFQDVELNDEEQKLLALLVQPMRAAELLRSCGLPPARAARALYALLALGMFVSIRPLPAARTQVASAPVAMKPQGVAAPPPAPPSPTAPSVAAPAARVPTAAPPAAAEAARHETWTAAEFETRTNQLLELAENGSYYQVLNVMPHATTSEIKRSYYALARTYHPDHHMGHSERIGPLQKVMEALTTAYKSLSDDRSRQFYDKELEHTAASGFGPAKTKRQETTAECLEKAKECLRAKNFAGSIVWLRKCVDLEPENSKHRAMLARSLGAVPQYRQEAIEHFEAAIRSDPWNISAYFQFGELYEVMNLPWRAKPLYQKILEIDPGHAKAQQKIRQIDSAEKSSSKDAKESGIVDRLFGRKA